MRLAIHQRHKLEPLCRDITRPAMANERLALNRAGQGVLRLKTLERAQPLSWCRRSNACNAWPRSSPVQGSLAFEASLPGLAGNSPPLRRLLMNDPKVPRAQTQDEPAGPLTSPAVLFWLTKKGV